jgi:hypothetical protein
MAQRVLVFEKDTNFVRELENGFGRVGAEIEVVRDADASIARARQGDVKLVLLAVEAMAAPGEAFLVCKRFKSDDDLAKIPFVIMGGTQHAESFESHKKLKKRRADEYVELPISFEGLLAKVGPLAGFADGPAHVENAGSSQDNDEDIIEAFTENAFGDLMREARAPGGRAPAVAPASAPAPSTGCQATSIGRTEPGRGRRSRRHPTRSGRTMSCGLSATSASGKIHQPPGHPRPSSS